MSEKQNDNWSLANTPITQGFKFKSKCSHLHITEVDCEASSLIDLILSMSGTHHSVNTQGCQNLTLDILSFNHYLFIASKPPNIGLTFVVTSSYSTWLNLCVWLFQWIFLPFEMRSLYKSIVSFNNLKLISMNHRKYTRLAPIFYTTDTN